MGGVKTMGERPAKSRRDTSAARKPRLRTAPQQTPATFHATVNNGWDAKDSGSQCIGCNLVEHPFENAVMDGIKGVPIQKPAEPGWIEDYGLPNY